MTSSLVTFHIQADNLGICLRRNFITIVSVVCVVIIEFIALIGGLIWKVDDILEPGGKISRYTLP